MQWKPLPETENKLAVTTIQFLLNPSASKSAHEMFAGSTSTLYKNQFPVGSLVADTPTSTAELAKPPLAAAEAIQRLLNGSYNTRGSKASGLLPTGDQKAFSDMVQSSVPVREWMRPSELSIVIT